MARPAGESVYLTNAIAAGVGLPMIVMSMTWGLPVLVLGLPALVMVTDALAYCAAMAMSPRLIVAGSGMKGRCSSMACVMNALDASSWPDCSVESSDDLAKICGDVAEPAGPPRIFVTGSDGGG